MNEGLFEKPSQDERPLSDVTNQSLNVGWEDNSMLLFNAFRTLLIYDIPEYKVYKHTWMWKEMPVYHR